MRIEFTERRHQDELLLLLQWLAAVNVKVRAVRAFPALIRWSTRQNWIQRRKLRTSCKKTFQQLFCHASTASLNRKSPNWVQNHDSSFWERGIFANPRGHAGISRLYGKYNALRRRSWHRGCQTVWMKPGQIKLGDSDRICWVTVGRGGSYDVFPGDTLQSFDSPGYFHYFSQPASTFEQQQELMRD